MNSCRDRSANARHARKGSALLMAFLMIILLYAIVFQLSYGTKADLRVAENDVTTTQMDMAIESALQEVYDMLKQDAAPAEGEGEAAAAGSGPPAGAGAPAAGGEGQEEQPADSRMDAWGRPQRSTIGDIELRILVQDEDGKINVLQLLFEDEDESEKALERLARLIDYFRDGSTVDVDRSEALRIAQVMREHLRNRMNSVLPRAKQMSDIEDNRERALPMTLKEFEVLERLNPSLFRDFRDERGDIVHSLGSYLTVWTSVQQGSSKEEASGEQGSGSSGEQGANAGANGQANAQGNDPNWGVCVNVNTAPVAVLKSLLDDRTVAPRFWDSVVEHRNLEKKEEEDAEGEAADSEPQLDEYGEEIVEREIFDTLEEVEEVEGWERLDDGAKDDVRSLLCVRSHVFSIYITARRKTGTNDDFGGTLGVPKPGEREDERGKGLVRTVRSVVWRKTDGEETQLVPLVRWEVLDYTPFEVIDYPVDGR